MDEKIYSKNDVLALIKTIDIQELLIPEGAKRKWYRFGAYDVLGILSDKILNEQKVNK